MTDSFGRSWSRWTVSASSGSFCPHWDDEEQRRPRYHELLKNGLGSGYAADAGVGLHFVNSEPQGAVGCDEELSAYRLEVVDGDVVETPIPTGSCNTETASLCRFPVPSRVPAARLSHVNPCGPST